MTQSTRRVVFLTCLIVLLTIPTELVLLRALAEPDQHQAIRGWAASLSSAQLQSEARRIQSYPVVYRREILRAASPDLRASVWRAHVDRYLAERPGLDVNTVAIIDALRATLTPELFDTPTDAEKAATNTLAHQVADIIGPDDARFLMFTLGPDDGTFASYEPLAVYLTNKVRGMFVVVGQTFDCDCSFDNGCFTISASCSYSSGCTPFFGWPGCGYFWNEPCYGGCLAGW